MAVDISFVGDFAQLANKLREKVFFYLNEDLNKKCKFHHLS